MNPSNLVLTNRGVRFAGQYFPCSIGKSGRTIDKKEGDLATPIGAHRIAQCFYRPDRVEKPNNWAIPILPGDLWSDDVIDPNYNQKVRAPTPFSHEKLRRPNPLYDIILTTNWNWPNAIPGKGSAIFLHQWRSPKYPTAGCIAFERNHMAYLAAHVTPETQIIIR